MLSETFLSDAEMILEILKVMCYCNLITIAKKRNSITVTFP